MEGGDNPQSHRHVTHENKGANEQRNDNQAYKPMGKALTEEEMKRVEEEGQGEWDKDGFYVLPDGSFYDPYGYYFDEEGYDEYGGYYDDDGYYVPGEGHEDEYYGMYEQETYIPESLE